MYRKICLLVGLICVIGHVSASERQNLLNETFQQVTGSDDATSPLNATKFGLDGWSFTSAYAGPECVIIKKGGTVTTPALPELTGNAAFSFDIGEWEDPTGQTPFDWENVRPHALSISSGTLSTDEYDSMTAGMDARVMYDVDATSRLTLTAAYDIMLKGVRIYYAGNNNSGMMTDFTTYSHETGDYYAPFDLNLTVTSTTVCADDGKHNILVYTLDGSQPTRTSTRYKGEPIHISGNTTLTAATIFGNGFMFQDKPRVYNFPVSSSVTKPANTFAVTVATPGKLKSMLLDIDADIIEGLEISGKLNSEDLKYLVGGEGRTGAITYLDLSEVTFDYDGGTYKTLVYAPEGGMGTTTTLYYCLSETNYDEGVGASPTSKSTKCYRNDLAGAFARNSKIEHVVLPKSLPIIGESMFEQCSALKSAEIPSEVTEVGRNAFYYCSNLELYEFPEHLTKIGSNAFAGVKLGRLTLGKDVKIGEAAFSGSTIAILEIPQPGDSIPERAFAYCNDLQEITIGEGLKFIGERAFADDWAIEKAQFPQSLEEVDTEAFSGCRFLKDIPDEEGIKYMGKVALETSDQNRSSYSVKEGTISLAPGLFHFSGATSFELPSSLEIIGDHAFAYSQITSLPELPNLKQLKNNAFGHCEKLARLTIPETVEFIDNAFEGCNSLWSVTYNAIDAECPSGVSPRDLERIVIGDKVKRLPAGLYTGNTNVTEVILPSSVEILDPNAFNGCSNLTYVRLSDNISTISDFCFYNCHSLTDLHWPARLKEIGQEAFRECTSLTTVSLPEGVEKVAYGAFSFCSGVENFYLASTISEIEYGAFTFYNDSKAFTITTPALTPDAYEWNWHYVGTPLIKVPASALTTYQADNNWNGKNYGKDNEIVSIEGISAPEGDSETTFSAGIDSDSDLSDAVIGDVYVTVGSEDYYDENDGSIVINSTMEDEYMDAIGGMSPGESDIANRFNGLIVKVPAGKGSVTVNCLTLGSKNICVKIGEDAPEFFSMNSKGDITIEYNVDAETCVYIYAADSESRQIKQRFAPSGASDNCVKIYAITINPKEISGIGETAAGQDSRIVEIYRLDGRKVSAIKAPGLYIIRKSDGTTSKVSVSGI